MSILMFLGMLIVILTTEMQSDQCIHYTIILLLKYLTEIAQFSSAIFLNDMVVCELLQTDYSGIVEPDTISTTVSYKYKLKS